MKWFLCSVLLFSLLKAAGDTVGMPVQTVEKSCGEKLKEQEYQLQKECATHVEKAAQQHTHTLESKDKKITAMNEKFKQIIEALGLPLATATMNDVLTYINGEKQRGKGRETAFRELGKELSAVKKNLESIVKILEIVPQNNEDISKKIVEKFQLLVRWHQYYKKNFDYLQKLLGVSNGEKLIQEVKELKNLSDKLKKEDALKQQAAKP